MTYLVLNLASGGLPGPNLVRYNKDLEVVAPLFCVALAVGGARAVAEIAAASRGVRRSPTRSSAPSAPPPTCTTKFVLER